MPSPDLTPWLAFCADILPLNATLEEMRRWRQPEEPEEDFEALLAAETSLPPQAGGAGGGAVVRARIAEQSTTTRNTKTMQHGRELRQNATEAEKKLWGALRNGQMHIKFRRQQALGHYIVDFLSHDAKLIVELDGGQHAAQQDYDSRRTLFLEALGYRVLRFWNNEVMENFAGVVGMITSTIATPPPTQPSPACGGGLPKLPPRAGGGNTPRLGHFDGVDAATARRMKRGQLVPDAVLDLHGFTLPEAFSALCARVRNARAQQVRLLLVITGKGRARGPGGVDGDGKLRQAMPHWLADAAIHPHVVAASAANRTHGGGGAFYLLLRKPAGRRA